MLVILALCRAVVGLEALQIQHLIQNSQSLPSTIAPQALAELVAGQRINAVVVSAALAAQVASIKVADTVLQITTPVALQQGQTVQIELIQSNGRPVLSLVPSELTQAKSITSQTLVQGQQFLAQVIKVVNDTSVIIELRSLAATPEPIKNQAGQPVGLINQQVEVDTSKLTKQFSVGDKVVVDVISSKPLAIELRAPTQSREQIVIAKLKQLLQQQTQTTKQDLTILNNATRAPIVSSVIRNEISHLYNNVLDKQSVNRPQLLQQALQQSGLFTEKQLLKQPASLNQDFKVNVLKVLARIESELLKNAKETLLHSNKTIGPLSKDLAIAPQPANRSSQGTEKVTQSLSVSTQSIINKLKSGDTSQENVKPQHVQLPIKQAVKTPEQQVKTGVETSNNRTELLALKPLSSLILSAFNRINSTSATILTSPPLTSLLSALPSLSNIAISTPSQAMNLAKLIAHTMASEKVRGLQAEFVVLQSLLREVESLHTRIQLNQFSMLKEAEPSSNMPTASWILDLPIKDQQDINFVQLQIDQHKNDEQEDDDDIWNVQLRLDTQNLGPLQATVTMYDSDIKVVLRAERAISADLLKQHLSSLESSIEKLGVSLSHVSCVCGEVAKPTLVQQYLNESESLVDVLI